MDESITAQKLSALITERQEEGADPTLQQYGGVAALCTKLGSDSKRGLSSTDLELYRTRFGRNYVPPKSLKSYIGLLIEASKDFTIFVLILAAIASIIFALILGEPLTEGGGILIAVVLVTNVAAVNDWKKQSQFAKLNALVADVKVIVLRDGNKVETVSTKVVVGDVIVLATGDMLCADGIFITGADVTTDESALTGESDLLVKSEKDPFMLSGTKVMSGSCTALCVAVGEHSESGRIAKLVSEEESETSVLKAKLENMVVFISKAGTAIALFCFFVMIIHFCVVAYAVTDASFECVNLGTIHCAGPQPINSMGCSNAVNVFTNATRTLEDCALESERACGSELVFENGSCSCIGVGQTCTESSGGSRYNTSGCRTIDAVDESSCTENSAIVGCEWVNDKCVNPIVDWCEGAQHTGQYCQVVYGWKTSRSNNRCVSMSEHHTTDGYYHALVLGSPCGWFKDHAGQFLNFFIIAVTILVVAIPEGLPLATTLSLAFSVMKMQKDNNLVKHLDACETMGSATRICSDKTGTLTQNLMTVVRLYLGATDTITDVSIDTKDMDILKDSGPRETLDILCSSFCAFGNGEVNYTNGRVQVLGNITECALLKCGDKLGYEHKKIRGTLKVAKVNVFSSERKRASSVIERNGGYRIYVQGASEIIVDLCTQIQCEGHTIPLEESRRKNIRADVISGMNNQAMRTISTAYRDVDASFNIEDVDLCESDLIFLGIMGIEDPIRPEVPRAIQQCMTASISVVMVTGDNIATAIAIAKQCGILRPGIDLDSDGKVLPNVAMTGPEFRKQVLIDDNINFASFDLIWPKLRVLARSSPSDKYTLVKGLNESEFYLEDCGLTVSPDRQVVAVTGDGTNDAPALKRADVGFAMGISGTSVAKDAADVIVLDDNFKSIVSAAKWGRNVYDSCTKFLQFQLTVNVVACLLAAIGAIFIADSPLKAVQMLWVNVIMDSLGALALATEPPTDEQLDRPPYGRNQTMISTSMKWNIIGHSIYQLVVMCVLLFAGPTMFESLDYMDTGLGAPHGSPPTVHFTLIFNTLVCMTLFNEFNCRKLFHERNVFSNISSNGYFFNVQFIQVVGQVLIVEFGGTWTTTAALPAWAWGVSVGLGASSLLCQQVIISIAKLCKRNAYSTKVKPLAPNNPV